MPKRPLPANESPLISWMISHYPPNLSQSDPRISWLQNIEIKPSLHSGGSGIYSGSNGIPKDLCMSIPASCVMTAQSAMTRSIGSYFSSSLKDEKPNMEFVLLCDMALGRVDTAHPFHEYLSSLPHILADVSNWPERTAIQLEGTNLGVACKLRRKGLEHDMDRFLGGLMEVFKSVTRENVVWASSMYTSRRFPLSLLHTLSLPSDDNNADVLLSEDDKKLGILLPVLDIMNHSPNSKVTWHGSTPTDLTVKIANSSFIEPNTEVFNNYGRKGNEQLMMIHGFGLSGNVEDVYGLSLSSTSEDGTKKSLGVHYIAREDNSNYDGVQFPGGLIKGLEMVLYGEEEEDESGGEEEEEVYGMDIESAQLLLTTLSERLVPFTSTRDRDIQTSETEIGNGEDVLHEERRQAIAHYRNGQRVVLEQAVETLSEMCGL